jgi:hypothetical protein
MNREFRNFLGFYLGGNRAGYQVGSRFYRLVIPAAILAVALVVVLQNRWIG